MKPLTARLSALLLLLCYSTDSTPLGTLVFLGLAQQDPAHEVRVATDARSVRVVLHHRAGCRTPRVEDHAGGVTRLLACLCKADAQGDHVFQEESGDALKENAASLKSKRAGGDPPVWILPSLVAAWNFANERAASHAGRHPQPPDRELNRLHAGMGVTSLRI